VGSRKSEVELCFDSMTDLITNLAGGLILVVLLLLGMTQAAPRTLQPRPGPDQGSPKDGERDIRPLVVRLALLQADLDAVNEAIDADAKQLKKLEADAAKLLDKDKTEPAPEPAPK
jgi:hypothetical protein